MHIQLLYFGRPADHLGIAQEHADVPDHLTTLAELLAWLRLRGGIWQQELADHRIRCAVNQEFCELTAAISPDDEIAFFSPISGG
ncbi:MAG: MoaD/ThiS family protein [Pseudomonadota bacterium]